MLTILNEIVRRTRQHHAIEHATIHVLTSRESGRSLSGISDPIGFVIYGDVETEEVRQAVGNALLRLQAGEHVLAIHPNCGTSLVTTAFLATFAAVVVSGGNRRSFLEKLALTLPVVFGVILFSKPLGLYLQTYTTLTDVADRWVMDVSEQSLGGLKAIRVVFE